MISLERRLAKLERIVKEKPVKMNLPQEQKDIVLRNCMRRFARENVKNSETLRLFLDVYGLEETCSVDPELISNVDTRHHVLGVTIQDWICEVHACGIAAAVRQEEWIESTTPEDRNRFKIKIVGPDGITDQKPYEHHFSSMQSRKLLD
jgi:hypothetical protein